MRLLKVETDIRILVSGAHHRNHRDIQLHGSPAVVTDEQRSTTYSLAAWTASAGMAEAQKLGTCGYVRAATGTRSRLKAHHIDRATRQGAMMAFACLGVLLFRACVVPGSCRVVNLRLYICARSISSVSTLLCMYFWGNVDKKKLFPADWNLTGNKSYEVMPIRINARSFTETGARAIFLAALAWLPYPLSDYAVSTCGYVHTRVPGRQRRLGKGQKVDLFGQTNLELGYQVVRVTADTIVHLFVSN